MKTLFRWQYVLGGTLYLCLGVLPGPFGRPEPPCDDLAGLLFLVSQLLLASILELPIACAPTVVLLNAVMLVSAHRFEWDWAIEPRPWFDSTIFMYEIPFMSFVLLVPLFAAAGLRRWITPRLRPLFRPKN